MEHASSKPQYHRVDNAPVLSETLKCSFLIPYLYAYMNLSNKSQSVPDNTLPETKTRVVCVYRLDIMNKIAASTTGIQQLTIEIMGS